MEGMLTPTANNQDTENCEPKLKKQEQVIPKGLSKPMTQLY